MDANWGYWQIEMDEASKDLTSFVSHHGLFRYKRMPFGLKNAPYTFQRAMDIILAPAKWQFAIVYLDDIIILSNTLEEHFEHIKVVMKLCQAAGLSLKLRKCFFFQQ